MKRALPLVLAIAAFFAGALLWLGTGRRVARNAFHELSSANTSDSGLSLAARYLAKNRKVSMLTRPLGIAGLERNAVVFRTGVLFSFGQEESVEEEEDDQKPAKKGEKKAEKKESKPLEIRNAPAPLLSDAEADWVRGGGRLVIAVPDDIGTLETRNPGTSTAMKVFPLWAGIDTLTLPERRAYDASSLGARMHAVYTAKGHVVLAREGIGAGEVLVLSVPEMLTNAQLRAGNHLALLLALAGEKRPVYFDELVHGMSSSGGTLELMRDWSLGPLLLMLGVACLLVLWRNARRIGPAEEEYRDTRSDAVDLVASLGALYERKTSDAEAIALYHEALTRSVAAQSGLRGEALHKRVADLTGGGISVPKATDKLPRATFQRMLMTINDAFRKIAERAGGVHADHR